MSAAPARPLDDVRRDLPALLDVLGIDRTGSQRCPFHDDRTASFSVTQNESGVWRWHCFAGCGGGSIVDALARVDGISTAEAIKRLAGPDTSRRRSTPKPRTASLPIVEPIPPTPDRVSLRRFHERATTTLFGNAELQARWLGKRGIPIKTAKEFGLGFLPAISLPGWKDVIKSTWVIPISDASGDVLALKLHRENPERGPKCLWLPVGTEPIEKPRHGWATLWPPPETFWPKVEFDERAAILEFDGGLSREEAERCARLEVGRALPWMYACPGELKALAKIGAGKHATSVTAGESHRWTPGLLSRLHGRRVCVVFDDDPAGHKFRDNTLAALRSVATELKVVTFGRKEIHERQN